MILIFKKNRFKNYFQFFFLINKIKLFGMSKGTPIS